MHHQLWQMHDEGDERLVCFGAAKGKNETLAIAESAHWRRTANQKKTYYMQRKSVHDPVDETIGQEGSISTEIARCAQLQLAIGQWKRPPSHRLYAQAMVPLLFALPRCALKLGDKCLEKPRAERQRKLLSNGEMSLPTIPE